MSYLIDKFKGTYRIKCPIDIKTHQFPRKLNGTYEDIDLYIDCYYGTQITYLGRSILQAYIPSITRGHNVINKIISQFGENIISNIHETDKEIIFNFNYNDSNKVIPLLNPKTNGSGISPYSSKNLPKNKDYKIPDEELQSYKEIVNKIPQKRILELTYMTNSYLKSLATKKNTWENIKADMIFKGLKGKEYIHSIGKWNGYILYLNKNLQV